MLRIGSKFATPIPKPTARDAACGKNREEGEEDPGKQDSD